MGNPNNKQRHSYPKRVTKQPGLPPGTPVFTGNVKMLIPNITITKFSEDECITIPSYQDRLPDTSGDYVLWIDIKGLQDMNLLDTLGKKYDIHALILEDVVDVNQRPKFDDYDHGVFTALQSMSYDRRTLDVNFEQITIYFNKRLIITFQEEDPDAFQAIRERLLVNGSRMRRNGTDYLAYALIDSIVDNYFVVLDDIDKDIEQTEEHVLSKADPGCKSNIHKLRLQLLTIRRSVFPLRDVAAKFAKSDSRFVSAANQVYLRDLYDHVVNIIDIVENYRDIVNGVNDLYLSEIGFKTNRIIQILTIISTIFMPLTFIVGVYGMNFDYMPELRWKYGYPLVMGFMAVITLLMLRYFKKKKYV